jgi:hypothetical protein
MKYTTLIIKKDRQMAKAWQVSNLNTFVQKDSFQNILKFALKAKLLKNE